MFALRFIGLALLVAYGWNMGKIPGNELNGFGKLVSLSFFLSAPALYFLPTYEAWRQSHGNLTAIALVNAFLGWTVLGWVIAVVWAFKRPEPVGGVDAAPATVGAVRLCPFCAEEIKIEAIKCKHCGSAIEPQSVTQ